MERQLWVAANGQAIAEAKLLNSCGECDTAQQELKKALARVNALEKKLGGAAAPTAPGAATGSGVPRECLVEGVTRRVLDLETQVKALKGPGRPVALELEGNLPHLPQGAKEWGDWLCHLQVGAGEMNRLRQAGADLSQVTVCHQASDSMHQIAGIRQHASDSKHLKQA